MSKSDTERFDDTPVGTEATQPMAGQKLGGQEWIPDSTTSDSSSKAPEEILLDRLERSRLNAEQQTGQDLPRVGAEEDYVKEDEEEDPGNSDDHSA